MKWLSALFVLGLGLAIGKAVATTDSTNAVTPRTVAAKINSLHPAETKSQSGLTSAATIAGKMMIVTCREKADLDALLAEHQIQPRFIYRAINGFAAALPQAAIERLKHNPNVLAVEADGPVSLCDQTNSPWPTSTASPNRSMWTWRCSTAALTHIRT